MRKTIGPSQFRLCPILRSRMLGPAALRKMALEAFTPV